MTEQTYKFLCAWCSLDRTDCVCDSPEFAEHDRCGECGVWVPLDELTAVSKPNTVEHSVCRGCSVRV